MTTDEVMARVLAERGHARGSWPWTTRFLALADRQFDGRWTHVRLPGRDAAGILLPAHAGEPCHGDRQMLVPAGGQSVESAARALAGMRDDYARDNAECWARISAAASGPFSAIVVSAEPLADEQYDAMPTRPGALYHVDGFHRLVGWALAGRLDDRAVVEAFVAG